MTNQELIKEILAFYYIQAEAMKKTFAFWDDPEEDIY